MSIQLHEWDLNPWRYHHKSTQTIWNDSTFEAALPALPGKPGTKGTKGTREWGWGSTLHVRCTLGATRVFTDGFTWFHLFFGNASPMFLQHVTSVFRRRHRRRHRRLRPSAAAPRHEKTEGLGDDHDDHDIPRTGTEQRSNDRNDRNETTYAETTEKRCRNDRNYAETLCTVCTCEFCFALTVLYVA